MNFRKATIDDIELLIKLRIDYLIADKGSLNDGDKNIICKQLKVYFEKNINNNLIVVLAEVDGVYIATAFLVIDERPANPSFITGKVGTILNVLTYRKFRKKGIAAKLLGMLIEEAKENNVSYIELSATKDGKGVYEKLGFITKESKYFDMKLNLL